MYRSLSLENTRRSIWIQEIALAIGASLLLGLFRWVSLPLPFTPVPLATQNSLVLLLAIYVGPRRALAAVLLFLIQGALGCPVFIHSAGLLGPTAGYLLGYLAAAYVTGVYFERCQKRTRWNAFWAMVLGNLVLYLLGAGYLAIGMGVETAFWLGIAPFILGDLFKILLATQAIHE